MSQPIKIEFLQPSMLDAYATHLQQHMNESGSDGLIYCPFNSSFKHQHDEIFTNVTKRLAEPLDALKWQRAFVLVQGDKIVGHLDLQGRGLETSRHRCQLGMGMDKVCRGQGLGYKLMSEAIKWVREETKIDWIDLFVFAHNYTAIALYKKSGFIQVGAVQDCFRVDDQSIDDLHMTLKVER